MGNKERLLFLSYKHKLSHLGSCLTALPIIESIYANKKSSDIFILGEGHAHLAHAVVMEACGGKDAEEELEKWGIHCDRRAGCDTSTGSLGQGIAIATGMAISERSKNVY